VEADEANVIYPEDKNLRIKRGFSRILIFGTGSIVKEKA
jgi:hypothetical protein